jgi:hypothetical protein
VSTDEWVRVLDSPALSNLKTAAEAKALLALKRQPIRSQTSHAVLKEYGYHVYSDQFVHGHANVQRGADSDLLACLFKILDISQRDREYGMLQRAHNFGANPFVCVAVKKDFPDRDGKTKYVLVMKDYGPSCNLNLPLPLRFLVRVALGLAAALAPFHLQSTCWGDVKPSNVVATNDGVVLLDAGSACNFGGPVKTTTAQYTLAMESIASAKFDLVCVAATLLEMFAPDIWKLLNERTPATLLTVRGECIKRKNSPVFQVVKSALDAKDVFEFAHEVQRCSATETVLHHAVDFLQSVARSARSGSPVFRSMSSSVSASMSASPSTLCLESPFIVYQLIADLPSDCSFLLLSYLFPTDSAFLATFWKNIA